MESQPISANPTELSSKKNLLITIGAAVLILLVGIALYKTFGQKSFTSEKVEVNTIETKSLEGSARLPAGFPTDTPVELQNITASETITYTDRAAVLSNVTYTSEKQLEELFVMYKEYFTKAKYNIISTNKLPTRMFLVAVKENNEITITITPNGPRSSVLVSLVTRGI